MEAGFEGSVYALSWLSPPTLGQQNFKQARWDKAPTPDLEIQC